MSGSGMQRKAGLHNKKKTKKTEKPEKDSMLLLFLAKIKCFHAEHCS